ncbi:hypothetical protein [Allostreptomyces psammosilenae]|uniref:Uncharacterized protein n=1 Tax=Allostreptomyces psammosilenae TaxID=1892865 RepID=A0A852ZLE5_9ACTN|nr:hypothetical protein [Allostreptomyces psammosilenae]NYI03213.1 hypothetical protein [Allostreptomyces psammosilenae]
MRRPLRIATAALAVVATLAVTGASRGAGCSFGGGSGSSSGAADHGDAGGGSGGGSQRHDDDDVDVDVPGDVTGDDPAEGSGGDAGGDSFLAEDAYDEVTITECEADNFDGRLTAVVDVENTDPLPYAYELQVAFLTDDDEEVARGTLNTSLDGHESAEGLAVEGGSVDSDDEVSVMVCELVGAEKE